MGQNLAGQRGALVHAPLPVAGDHPIETESLTRGK